MAITERARVFNSCLARTATPRLLELGFEFDGSRSYRRYDCHGNRVEIVNFQLGQRSLEGRFTVNLGALSEAADAPVEPARTSVTDCTRWQRIGLLLPPKSQTLQHIPLLGLLFAARDRWWRFDDDVDFTLRQLADVTDRLLCFGVPWLESGARPPGRRD